MSKYPHAVVFAGGKSSRMKEDKSLLPFGGHSTLTDYQYNKLQKVFHRVFVSAKNDKFDLEYPMILDKYPESSPLVAILSLFETIEALEEVFILSVDAPFVDTEVIAKLMETKTQDLDAIIAKSPSGVQPLCGVYKRSILPIARQQYEKGNHKLIDLLANARTRMVEFGEDTPFTNLNHPEEYKEALKTIGEIKS